jgi:hypothetical protein
MFQRKAFQQIVSEVSELLPYVRLKIPASAASVRQQMGYLSQAQNRLQTMQEKTASLLRKNGNAAINHDYQRLIGLVQELEQNIKDLKLLAEEYPVDPEGTVSCLQTWQEREAYLLRQINSLKMR